MCSRSFFFQGFQQRSRGMKNPRSFAASRFFSTKKCRTSLSSQKFRRDISRTLELLPRKPSGKTCKKTGDFGKHLEIGIYAILNPRLPRCHSSNPEVGACPRHRFFTSRAASSSPRVQQTPLATPLREAPMAQQQQACSELK